MTSELAVVDDDTVKRATAASPRRNPKITIFGRWCKGCGICSAFCPTKAIEADQDGRPQIVHPERCNACRMCVLRCPDMAITVTGQESE